MSFLYTYSTYVISYHIIFNYSTLYHYFILYYLTLYHTLSYYIIYDVVIYHIKLCYHIVSHEVIIYQILVNGIARTDNFWFSFEEKCIGKTEWRQKPHCLKKKNPTTFKEKNTRLENMKSFIAKRVNSILVNLRYLRFKLLKYIKNKKICNTFYHNFKNIPLYIIRKVSLERY